VGSERLARFIPKMEVRCDEARVAPGPAHFFVSGGLTKLEKPRVDGQELYPDASVGMGFDPCCSLEWPPAALPSRKWPI
jgi:hypothetical protein